MVVERGADNNVRLGGGGDDGVGRIWRRAGAAIFVDGTLSAGGKRA